MSTRDMLHFPDSPKEQYRPTPRDWDRFYAELGALGITCKGPENDDEWPGDQGPWPDENEEDPHGGQ